MSAPSTAVRLEIALVAATVVPVALVRHRLPHAVALGDLFFAGAIVLLAQGLARDLARLASRRRAVAERKVTCVCVESVVGLGSVVAGAALVIAGSSVRVPMAPAAWPLALACVALLGTATREIVFDWRRGRFRREVDHGANVVWRG